MKILLLPQGNRLPVLNLPVIVWLTVALFFSKTERTAGAEFFPPCNGSATEIGGKVFRDYNANGLQDINASLSEPGMPGITVSAYGVPGLPISIATSQSDGTYLLTGLTPGAQYRIEFTWTESWLQPGAAGGTTVQFAMAGSCDVNVGVNNPADYCQSDPNIFTNCYVEHNQLSGSNSNLDVLVQMPYSAGNASATTPNIDLPAHVTLAVANQIGTTYGLAYQKSSNTAFSGAFMKRHCGFGPDTTGAIYKIDLDNNSVSTFLDLNDLFGPGTAGNNPHPNAATGTTLWQRDANAWDKVGKIALGDIDISEDELYLWAINLADRKLYKIPLASKTDPVPPSAGQISRYPAAGDLSGLSGLTCPNVATDIRPFGLGIKDGLVYVGLICTAESTLSAGDMEAYVYSFDPATEIFTKVLEFPLDYNRGNAIRASVSSIVPAEWNPWKTTFTVTGPVFGSEYAHPQPMLTDIVFYHDQMIIGLRDRFGDQMGYDQLHPASGTTLYRGDSAGDMLKASSDGAGGWTIEDNAGSNPAGTFGPSAGANTGQGPGEGEFFYQDRFPVSGSTIYHDEVLVGGLLQIPGFPQVASTQFDPVDNVSTAFDGGIFWMSHSTGQRSRAYRVFDGGSSDPLFGKANGLGDLEAMCDPAPIEVGNFVWLDTDSNGIQDPGEPGLDGLWVKLYKNGVAVDSVQTAGGGFYGFSNAAGGSATGFIYGVDSLLPEMEYKICVEIPANMLPSPFDNGGVDGAADLRDNDGTLDSGCASVTFTTGPAGANNHSYDFGFSCQPLPVGLLDQTICEDETATFDAGADLETYTWSTGETTSTIQTNVAGTYAVTVTDENGCSGVDSATLIVLSIAYTEIEATICEGDTYEFGGQSLTDSGMYYDTLTAANGCDSIVTLNLSLDDFIFTYIEASICEGESYEFDGQQLTYDDIYQATYSSVGGCDSIVTLTLTVLPVSQVNSTATICEGESYNFNGQILTASGFYVDTLTAANGCDSITTLDLTVKNLGFAVFNEIICEGESYNLNGELLTTSGTYIDTLEAVNGCDSIVTLNLTVQTAMQVLWQDTVCEGSAYPFFGQILTSAGTYFHSLTYASGCDSLQITLQLAVDNNCIFDLALRKTLAPGQPSFAIIGDTVAFTITIFNQGNVEAYNVQVLDYVPFGLTFQPSLNPGWIDFGAGPSIFIGGPLLPEDSASFEIKLIINGVHIPASFENFAEITAADNDTDAFNTPPTDVDSNPNAFVGDDAGAQPGSPSDDAIFGDGTGTPGDSNPATDEDDHDVASIELILLSIGNLVFEDLGNDGIFNNNDKGIPGVEVELYEAGPDGMKVTGDDILKGTTTTDSNGYYLFTGLTKGLYYVKLTGDSTPPGYVSSTGDGPFDNDGSGPVEPYFGTDNDFDQQDDGTQMGIMVMSDTVRLDYFTEPTADGDTDPNTNLTVDFGLYNPDKPVFDLALRKRTAPGQPQYFKVGDQIHFTVTVFNQGNADAYDLTVADYIPVGLSLDDAGWTTLSANLATTSLGFLAAGDSIDWPLTLKVTGDFKTYKRLVNYAEIASADEDDIPGNTPPVDIDSQPDTLKTNDIGGLPDSPTDDEISDNGTTDEDDHDPSTVVIIVPADPEGYIYCDKTGKLLTGGTISVNGPGAVNIVKDGSDGSYQFFTDGTPGVYTISYSHPNGYPLSTSCPPQPDTLNLTNFPDPYTAGTTTLDSTGMFLDTTDCVANPFYQHIYFGLGDTVVFGNNIAVQCVFIGSIVCEDIDHNDFPDGSEPGFPGIVVHLYDCADTINPISSTTTDNLGEYRFDGLPAGDYRIQFIVPAGFRPMQGSLVDENGFSDCITLDFGECDTTTSLCLYACPGLDAGQNFVLCFGDTAQLLADIPYGNGSFNWSPATWLSNPNIFNPLASPLSSVTYTVNYDDGFGCTASDSISVFVVSTTPFMINFPFTDSLVECGASIPFEAPVFGDGCDSNLTIVFNEITTPFTCGFTIERTWTATNNQGNSLSFSQTVTVEDTTPPVFSNTPANVTMSCGQPIPPPVSVIATDACDDHVTLTYSQTTSGSIATCDYQITRTYFAVDDCGLVTTTAYTVFVIDTTPPALINVPADLTTNCVNTPPVASVTAADNCDSDVPVIFSETILPGAVACEFTLARTWTATDDCGNTGIATQNISLIDSQPPVITILNPMIAALSNGDTVYLECHQIAPLDESDVSVSDDCCPNPAVQFQELIMQGDCDSLGYIQFMRCGWVATDCCGNSSSFFFHVVVVDNTPPVLYGVPGNVSIGCDTMPSPPGSVLAVDNCDHNLPVSMTEDTIFIDGTNYQITRTWSATDDCGNIGQANQVISIQDNVPPMLVNVPADTAISCSESIPLPANVEAIDDCDSSPSLSFEETANGSGCSYTLTRTWTTIDSSGNETSASQIITVYDTELPVLNGVPADTLISCSDGLLPLPLVTATDNCDSNVVIVFTETIDSSNLCSIEVTRTWSATDDCGNTISASQITTLTDNQPPVLNGVPNDTVISCGEPMPVPAVVSALDNCDDDVDLDFEETIDSSGCTAIFTRTWTATDNCGNIFSASQIISLIDTLPPVLVGLPNDTVLTCNDALLLAPTVTAVDNCDGIVSVSFSEIASVDPCNATTIRTWSATDDCGNTAFASQTITLTDDQPPVLHGIPADTTFSCDETQPGLPVVTVTDNCDSSVVVIFSETVDDNNPCLVVTTRTWTATDNCGNTVVATQVVSLEDDQLPGLNGVPADTILSCGEPLSSPPVVTGSDYCDDDVEVSFSEIIDTINSCTVTVTRTWTAIDNCGFTETASQVITFTDTDAPVILPVNENLAGLEQGDSLFVSCDAVPVFDSASVVATDNCDDSPTVVFSSETLVEPGCQSADYLKLQLLTWSALDNCGNATAFSVYLAITDTIPPAISNVPPDLTIQCDEQAPLDMVSVTDNCDASPDFVFDEKITPGACSGNYQIQRTWSATDACGNLSIASRLITVVDTIAPVFDTLPSDLQVDCGWASDIVIINATDNCDNSVSVTFEEDQSGDFCNFTVTRTWTATDNCGNSASHIQVITVADTLPPVLTNLPADTTVNCGNIPTQAFVLATDNCDTNVIITFEEISSGDFCNSTITRTWTATDDCGNSASHTQAITVTDNQPPVFGILPKDTIVDCGNVPPAAIVSATDNCDTSVTITFEENLTGNSCNFAVTRTWTATDDCGNSATHTQTISVSDNQPPVFGILPKDTIVDCGNVPPAANVSATDNCDTSVTITFEENLTGNSCNFAVTRTWTATDDCGNAVSHTQLITTADGQPPVFDSLPADTTVECDNIPPPVFLSATDNCDQNPVVTVVDSIGGGCPCEVFRTYSAIDFCGNTATYLQLLTVIDTTAPVFPGFPADTVILCGQVPAAEEPQILDNCDSTLNLVFSEIIDTVSSCVIQITRTWMASDDCSNVGVATQHLTVIPISGPPVFTFVPADTTVFCNETVPDFGDPIVTDDCGQVNLAFTDDSLSLADGYELVRTWTATDNCGSSTVVSQTIHVQFGGAPVLESAPGDTTIYINAGESVPPPANVVATEFCTGEMLPVSFDESQTVDGCDTIIVRTWFAVSFFGDTASVSQTIFVVTGFTIQVSTSPETCAGNNGSASLFPDTLSYNWSDGAMGAHRTGLSAGTYWVFVIKGGCADTLHFTIDYDCPCVLTIDSVNVVNASCGIADGSAAVYLEQNEADYIYFWSPNLGTPVGAGNVREDLPAGHYDVSITLTGNDTCEQVVGIDVFDDCARCASSFNGVAENLEFIASPGKFCLPVPFGAIIGQDITFNDTPYTGSNEPCDYQSVISYQYSSLPGFGQTGLFSVRWQYGNKTFYTLVSSMSELAAAMNSVDPAGEWKNDRQLFGLLSLNVGAAYGEMEITHVPTGETVFISPSNVTRPMGAKVLLPAGTTEIVLTDSNSDCSDSLTVTIEEETMDSEIIAEKESILQFTCYEGKVPGYCLGISFSDLSLYEFKLNGAPYQGDFGICDYMAGYFYTYAALPGQGNEGPYILENWKINGTVYYASFQNLQELIGLMNQWDASGQWSLDTVSFSIVGGSPAKTYSPLKIRQVNTGITATLELNLSLRPGSALVEFPEGINTFIVNRLSDGASDTLSAIVACVTTDYLGDTVKVAEEDFLCLNLDELIGEPVSIENVCDEGPNAAAHLDIISGAFCIRYRGNFEGESDGCFIICDDYGICDTTYLKILVKNDKPEEPENDIVVYNGFSPNGDGINDYLHIDGLQKYPNHSLKIFNRWGSIVFSTDNYKNDWNGTWNKGPLPDGTYFYILENGEGKTYKGYIQIHR